MFDQTSEDASSQGLYSGRLAPVTFAIDVVKLDNIDVMKHNYYVQKNYS